MKSLVRILAKFLPRPPRACTILQNTLHDTVESFKENEFFLRLENAQKGFNYKQIPRIAKNHAKKFKKNKGKREKARGLKIPFRNRVHRKKPF